MLFAFGRGFFSAISVLIIVCHAATCLTRDSSSELRRPHHRRHPTSYRRIPLIDYDKPRRSHHGYDERDANDEATTTRESYALDRRHLQHKIQRTSEHLVGLIKQAATCILEIIKSVVSFEFKLPKSCCQVLLIGDLIHLIWPDFCHGEEPTERPQPSTTPPTSPAPPTPPTPSLQPTSAPTPPTTPEPGTLLPQPKRRQRPIKGQVRHRPTFFQPLPGLF